LQPEAIDFWHQAYFACRRNCTRKGRDRTRVRSQVARNPLTEQLLDLLYRTGQHSAISAFDNRPLNQVWVFDHHRDDLAVGDIAFGNSEFTIEGLLGSQ